MSRCTALMGLCAAVLGAACASKPLPARSANSNATQRPDQAQAEAADPSQEEPPLFGTGTMPPDDPQAEADIALLDGPCKPFLALVQVASLVEGGQSSDSWELVQHTGVVTLTPELLGQCAEAMSRGLQRFR